MKRIPNTYVIALILSSTIICIHQAQAQNPEAEAVFNRGVQEVNANQMRSAISDFSRAISLAPDVAKYYNMRGFVYWRTGATRLALKDYNTALSLAPPSDSAFVARVLKNRGDLYRIQFNGSKNREAMDDYNKAIQLAPKYVIAYLRRGGLEIELQMFTNARADFSTCIALDPKSTAAFQDRAVANFALGRTQDAEADLEKAIELSPEQESAIITDYKQWQAAITRLRAMAAAEANEANTHHPTDRELEFVKELHAREAEKVFKAEVFKAEAANAP